MPVSGAKNSALKLMAATLLAPGKTTLQNVPDISDVHVMGKVLKGMGATIDVLDEHTLEIDTSQVDSWEAPYELVAKMRASTAVMGPLLGRFHRAKIAMPGGCNLGARKIDMHILGLEALGVEFDTAHGYINANAPQGLRGTTVTLEFASVGATENLIMAAVRAQGTTVIDNAAREPEIVDLANMLNEMGAKIVGAGTPVVTIEGVEELHPVTHRVVGDRIEAGTFIVAGALMADDRGVDVTGFCPIHLGMVLKKMELMGIDCERVEDGVHVNRAERIKPVDIQTLPFPGFPTDMQAQIMVLSALADGRYRPSITSSAATSSLSKSCRRLARMSSILPSPIPSSTNTGCLCLIKSPSRIPPPEDPQLVRRPRSTVAITWLAIPSALVNVAVATRFVTSRSLSCLACC